MRREQNDESVRQSSSDDTSGRRESGELGGEQGRRAGPAGGPTIDIRGGDRPTSPPKVPAAPADEWDGKPEETLGRDLDSENS